jgi:hypothetical protein
VIHLLALDVFAKVFKSGDLNILPGHRNSINLPLRRTLVRPDYGAARTLGAQAF